MNNKLILANRWKYTDRALMEYLKTYKKVCSKTSDKVQDIFNSIDYTYTDLKKPISTAQRNKFLRVIEDWKDNNLLNGYFKYIVETTIKKTYITNEEMLELLLWGAYVQERSQLDEYEQVLFTEVGQDLYTQGIEEIKPKKKKKWSLTWEYIWALLCLPNARGNKWVTYIEALALSNAQEIKKQAMICLQQEKKLNIDDDVFKNIIKKQENRYLCINDDKYSGALESQVREVANQSLLKAGEDVGNKDQKAVFIAEIDKVTTEMCKSMNGMLFNVNDWNRFYRYSAMDGRDVFYTVMGLEVGINLPPINNHIHACRSTITYLTDMKYKELLAEYNQLRKIIPNEIPNNIEEYAQMRYNIDGYYEEIKDKEEVGKHFNKYYEIKEVSNVLNHISFKTYYDSYSNARNELSKLDVKDIGDVRLSTHAFDRIIERQVDLVEIKKVLKETPTYNEKNNSINYENDNIKLAIGSKTHDIATIINYKGW